MMRIVIILLGLSGLASARPTFLPVTYATLPPGAQISAFNGPPASGSSRIAIAETQRAIARPVSSPVQAQRSPLHAEDGTSVVPTTIFAPLGVDGRVVDTAEVAAAKTAHAAAHANERLNLANEAARSGEGANADALSDNDSAVTTSEPGSDTGFLDESEVAMTRVNEKINLANEAARTGDVPARDSRPVVPLTVLGDVLALVPVDANVARSSINASPEDGNPLRSVNALAIAGPALAYGRVVY